MNISRLAVGADYEAVAVVPVAVVSFRPEDFFDFFPIFVYN